MMTTHIESDRRLYRDADRAMLGGVCAGLAGYLGFNLRVTRILAFIAFLMAMPIAVISYLAAVFLIPSTSNSDYEIESKRIFVRRRKSRSTRRSRREERREAEKSKPTAAADINRRCRTLDERLVRLEKHVTSRRFQLDQELSRL
jgi:phage shock protein C